MPQVLDEGITKILIVIAQYKIDWKLLKRQLLLAFGGISLFLSLHENFSSYL